MEFNISFKTSPKQKNIEKPLQKKGDQYDSLSPNIQDTGLSNYLSPLATQAMKTPNWYPLGMVQFNIAGLQDNDILLYLFNNVDSVNAIVTYISQVMARIPIKHYRILANGKKKDLGDTDILKLLRMPNSIHSGREFSLNNFSSFFTFGNIYINKIKSIGFPGFQELWSMPSNRIWVMTEHSYGPYGMLQIGFDMRLNKIKYYNWKIDNHFIPLYPEEIIHIKDSNITSDRGAYLYGQARLYSATRTVETLSKMVDSINTILDNNGAGGIISRKPDATKGADSSFWDPEDKKNIEDSLYNYGYTKGRRPIAISTADLAYIKLDRALRDFMPVALSDHDFDKLCNVLGGFPSVLLNSKKASTYNNFLEAMKSLYINIAIPTSELYYEALSEGLGLNENKEKIEIDIDAIEVLQSDKKSEADKLRIAAQGIQILVDEMGIVTPNDALEFLGFERVNKPGFDEYRKPKPKQQINQVSQTETPIDTGQSNVQ